jgi:hypothetical protein
VIFDVGLMKMKTVVTILIAALCAGCSSTQKTEYANYHRELRSGETVLIGNIEYLREWCEVGDKMSCYTIQTEDGNAYPLIFEPMAPVKVFPGEYDITGHVVATDDKRFSQAISVRLWSRVK